MNDPKRTPAAALCTAALLVAICTPAAANTLAATGAPWRVTAAGPAAGWDTSASFDDMAWQSATALCDVSQYLGSAWSAAGCAASATADTGRRLRRARRAARRAAAGRPTGVAGGTL